MMGNIQTLTQEQLFRELSDGGDMKSLFQILVYVSNTWISEFSNLYIILPSWNRFCGPAFFITQELSFSD